MPLSDQEIKSLVEKAHSCIESFNLSKTPKDQERFLEEAIECYNQIIENAPPHPYYFRMRAEILFTLDLTKRVKFVIVGANLLNALDLTERAIKDMNRAIELDPDQGEYYERRAEILLKKLWRDDNAYISDADKNQLLKKIIADYKAAVERNPSSPKIWLNLIEFNILSHNWDDAISIYGSCGQYIDTKEDKLIRSWLGCLALTLAGDLIEEEDKRPLYDQTIRIGLTLRILRITSISFLNEIEEKGGYKEKWEKAIEIHKLFIDHIDDWEDKGDILKKLRCYKEAVEAYDKKIKLHPDDVEVLAKKGEILYYYENAYEEALEIYNKIIKLQPRNFKYWGNKSEILCRLGRYEEALEAFNKSYEEAPDFYKYNFVSYWKKISILILLKRYEEVLKECDKVIDCITTNVDHRESVYLVYRDKGICLKKLKRYEEALDAYTKLIEIDPKDAYAWYVRACIYSLKNDKENALINLSKAIELDTKYKETAKNDEGFKTLLDDEDFKRIVG